MRAAEARQERAQGLEVQPGQVQEPEREQAVLRGPEQGAQQVRGLRGLRGLRAAEARRCPERR